jgi:outer membrane protein
MKLKISSLVLTLFFGFTAIAQEQVALEEVIRLALERNYDVLLVKNTASSASLDNNYVLGAFLPQLNGTAGKVWNENDQKQEFSDNTVRERNGIESTNTTASLLLTWTLFDGTKMFATRERVQQTDVQGQLLVKDQMVNTIADVINNYYNIVRQKQQLRAIEEQMAVSVERVKLAEKKLQVGTGVKPELLQAKVDLNAQRAGILQQETLISQLKDQLNGLVGLQLPKTFDVTDSIAINLDIDRATIESNIENTNYGLQAARQNLTISKLAIRERRGEMFPVVNFNSAYNFTRNENSVAINNFTPLLNQNKGLNYGLSVTVPILNGFNRRRLTQQAKISYNYQEIFYNQQKTNVNVALSNALVNYDNAKKILLVEEETIGLAKENVFIALETFKRGVTTFIELRTAQQSLAEAYNRLIAARFNAKVAETELLRLNGSLLK